MVKSRKRVEHGSVKTHVKTNKSQESFWLPAFEQARPGPARPMGLACAALARCSLYGWVGVQLGWDFCHSWAIPPGLSQHHGQLCGQDQYCEWLCSWDCSTGIHMAKAAPHSLGHAAWPGQHHAAEQCHVAATISASLTNELCSLQD